MIIDEEAYLAHYGILRKSGRYPWGSGGTQTQRNKSFLDTIDDLKRQGLSDTEICRGFSTKEHPFTTTQLRAARSIARNEQKQVNIAMAERLRQKGLSNIAIGERMGINESSVRALLAPGQKDKTDILDATADSLKREVEKKKYLDVGVGVEHHVGVSRTKLNTAIALLKEEGYGIHYVKVEQLGTGLHTTITVLAKPGTEYSEVFKNRDKIQQYTDMTDDGGRSYFGIKPPIQVNPKRVEVRYKEQGGADADGVIYVRPGVDDLSLGKGHYAQVRVAVGGTHFLKGMAMYKDDLPPGVDLVFNTNKSNTGNKLDAMKPLKDDPDNPFGAVIRQLGDHDAAGNIVKVKSAMNIVNDEGDWEKWSKSLSSQFLSKQSRVLAKNQLNMTYERKRAELDEILSLTNAAVKRKLLNSFEGSADSSAVHLKAAALPRQATHVILPVSSLKEGEIYAPNFNNGERVVLIRHPHAGIFEIPELTVNNRNQEAKKILGGATAAVGINAKVAQRLSGADFDGDTVLVIPNGNKKVKTAPALEGLKNFDPVHSYPAYEGMKPMDARTKGIQMGIVSNLITDMTIQGANNTELARAVRHSMVVIDAEKHNLDYKRSAVDNGIQELMKKYQDRSQGGAATLISRAGSQLHVAERKPRSAEEGGPIDRATGKKVFTPTGASFIDRNTGKTVVRTERTTKLAETDDARTLISGQATVIEQIYADHSNKMKALANEARKALVHTAGVKYSPSAKNVYSNEVATLDAKLNIALRNAPLERQAQVLANSVYAQKKAANPDMEKSEIKKVKGQALTEARIRTGAKKTQILITDTEWNAIQAGAISNDKLSKILDNSDLERVKQLATPKSKLLMTSTKKARAKAMISSGYTQAEIAQALGVSLTTLKTSLGE